MTFLHWLAEMHSTKNNTTPDHGRVWGSIYLTAGLGLEIYSVVWQHAQFHMETFGIGIGALFAGVGLNLNLKKQTEPDS